VHRPVCDGLFDEGHAIEVCAMSHIPDALKSWLTTDQAQRELVDEVLGKFRGSSAGAKPTVKNVREAAARWKAMIAIAEQAAADLGKDFVKALAASEARTEAAVQRVASEFRRKAADAARGAADEAERITAFAGLVILGDALKAIPELAPKGIGLVLTDPPYGQAFVSGRRTTTAKKSAITADDDIDVAVALLRSTLQALVPKMAEDSTALVFTGWRFEPEFRAVIAEAGLALRQSLVWVKNNHGSGALTTTFAPQHERILYAVKGNPKLLKRPPDVLYGKDKQDSDHPTEKPVDLLAQLVEATTEKGDMVVDPFAGSGSTLIAALTLGRGAWGCELDPGYHRIAEGRLLELAKKDAA
jgi:site-specific DNA-methyltransferase (adenine-specific)